MTLEEGIVSTNLAASRPKRRNAAIEFWRFFASVIILGYHISLIFPMLVPDNVVASPWMTGGGEVLFIFTLTSGYFLAAHFHSRMAKVEGYAQRPGMARAWDYLLGRLKGLLPELCVGILLGIVSVAVYQQAAPTTVLAEVVNGLWEFLGVYALGFTAAFGQANGALWFVSALFVCSYLLYFFMCKSEDMTVGLFAPVVFFLFEGWWCKTGIRASQQAFSTAGGQFYANNMAVNGSGAATAALGVNNGLIFVLVGMCGGILLYYAVRALKKVEFSAGAKGLLGVLYAALSIVLITYMVNPTWYVGILGEAGLARMTVHLFVFVLIGLTLLHVDPVSQAIDHEALAPVLSYLGKISMYIYIVHQPMIYFAIVAMGRGQYGFEQLFPPVFAASLVLSVLMQFIKDRRAAARTARAAA